MCGIVGYTGHRCACPILINGLKRLEYRGYDSAGVALINPCGEINIYKAKGKVAELECFMQNKPKEGCTGIAHTRWATHGEPNKVNAHPHYSSSERIALIHNGIIENYSPLREMLIQNGYEFKSTTDTEVLVQLIEFVRESEVCDLLTAIRVALGSVVGSYAIAIIERDNPGTIIAARKSSPLVVGVGDGEFFIASDASAIIEYTSSVTYLNDEEVAVMSLEDGLKVVNLLNQELIPAFIKLDLTLSQLEKSGYEHFMLKEIFEQPKTIFDCTRGRINVEGNNIALSGIIDNRERFLNARRIIIVACGTSWHSALIGEHILESLCRIPVEVEYASEFRYRNPVIYPDDIVIAISQSGETADTLAAVELAKSCGAFVYGICNAVGSSISRAAHSGSYIHVGPEIGVASTKAFTGQITVLIMMALALADPIRGDVVRELNKIPGKIEEILRTKDSICELANSLTDAKGFIYLGRGINYPVALEGALKLKEITYTHAEGYPAAEMKHGPIALVEEGVPVIVIATDSSVYDKVISNIQEIKARRGRVIAVVTRGDTQVVSLADSVIEVPPTIEYLNPLLSVIPLQLLAYHIAVNKGLDVDQPRNLAKSVTVE
ncbi:MAG: glutamine--fructose-6-phosphate transaminase (isomerizing) [Bacteroidetes bacterium HGW-Bacteroidetes-8]|jgi:glucosamine--fructose-6-phosphate aminotransferase (isomerizing)|nr:MAG: glutamine--fructose-6-phosphate transaminase (isomerizing) [Bacteroidetes bacterium HGW-Bacteroidetes-8]